MFEDATEKVGHCHQLKFQSQQCSALLGSEDPGDFGRVFLAQKCSSDDFVDRGPLALPFTVAQTQDLNADCRIAHRHVDVCCPWFVFSQDSLLNPISRHMVSKQTNHCFRKKRN